MVVACSAFYCQERVTLESRRRGISFHKFPRDPYRRKRWQIELNRLYYGSRSILWEPKVTDVVCSNHFRDQDFYSPGTGKLLKNNAIPILRRTPYGPVNYLTISRTPLMENIESENLRLKGRLQKHRYQLRKTKKTQGGLRRTVRSLLTDLRRQKAISVDLRTRVGEYNDTCCSRCLRSSPCASLCGLIATFIGLGFACGGLVFGIQFTKETLGIDPFFYRIELIPYIVTGSTAFYMLLAYILCAICSGSNMHFIFSKDSHVTIGRALNILIIFGCLTGVLAWVLATCLLWTPVYAVVALYVRESRLNLTATSEHDMSYYGIYGTHGLGVRVTDEGFRFNFLRLLTCFSMCLSGCVLVIMGFVHVAVCCGINYARLEEMVTYGVGITKNNSAQADTHL